MLLLDAATSTLLRVVTDAAGDIECHAEYAEISTATPGVFQQVFPVVLASITSATTQTILAGSASNKRNVRGIHIFNRHASQAVLVTVHIDDGTNIVRLAECTLLAGESLVFTQTGRWIHYDVNTAPYPAVGAQASQAEMEAGASTVTTVSPGRQHMHPSACKCWGKAVGAGTSLTVNYNTSGISDTGTGRLGVTIGTDFSSANYAIGFGVERTVTALTASGVEDSAIRNASPAAGSFEIESYDQTTITFVAQDPQNYFWECFGDQ